MLGANVESKTRCADLEEVARLAASLGARYEGRLDQVDTYFRVPSGRLKLREIAHRAPDGRVSVSAELIRFTCSDQSGARVSRCQGPAVDDAETCRGRLEQEHGLRGQIRKRR